MESQGYTNATSELSKTVFLGKEQNCLSSNGELQENKIYQMQVVVKEGRYLATITATTFGEDNTADLIARFVEP